MSSILWSKTESPTETAVWTCLLSIATSCSVKQGSSALFSPSLSLLPICWFRSSLMLFCTKRAMKGISTSQSHSQSEIASRFIPSSNSPRKKWWFTIDGDDMSTECSSDIDDEISDVELRVFILNILSSILSPKAISFWLVCSFASSSRVRIRWIWNLRKEFAAAELVLIAILIVSKKKLNVGKSLNCKHKFRCLYSLCHWVFVTQHIQNGNCHESGITWR